MDVTIGTYGVWLGRAQWSAELAASCEALGFGALWIGGSPPADLTDVERLLDATEHVAVGTSIVNVWDSAAEAVADSFHRIDERHPGRFLLGLGIGHPEAIASYRSPMAMLTQYLDDLDRAGVPPGRRAL